MPIAVIALAFDPATRVLGIEVRLETAFLAGAILVALLVAAWLAGRVPWDGRAGLRRDDLLFIVLGVSAGAVVGGRAGYVLLHVDYYAANPGAIVDPAQGGLELALAVVGGALGGSVIASLVDGPVGAWLDLAAVPALALLALGKVATALGGGGQGLPADLPWATSYVGAGPWRSLAPSVASHPSQLYEAAATFAVLVVVLGFAAGGRARWDGRLFLAAIGLWALGRALVATTWRDAAVLGPLDAAQLVALAVAAGAAILWWAAPSAAWSPGRPRRNAPAEPDWPDPASRPRF